MKRLLAIKDEFDIAFANDTELTHLLSTDIPLSWARQRTEIGTLHGAPN
jgi:hypothetical protein